MTPTMKALGIDQLSFEDRLALVQEIWDSIAAEPPARLTAEQKAELDRRLAEHERNPGDVVPWTQIKAEALERLQK